MSLKINKARLNIATHFPCRRPVYHCSYSKAASPQLPLEEVNVQGSLFLLRLVLQVPLDLYNRIHLLLDAMALHVSIPAFYLVKHSKDRRKIKISVGLGVFLFQNNW